MPAPLDRPLAALGAGRPDARARRCSPRSASPACTTRVSVRVDAVNERVAGDRRCEPRDRGDRRGGGPARRPRAAARRRRGRRRRPRTQRRRGDGDRARARRTQRASGWCASEIAAGRHGSPPARPRRASRRASAPARRRPAAAPRSDSRRAVILVAVAGVLALVGGARADLAARALDAAPARRAASRRRGGSRAASSSTRVEPSGPRELRELGDGVQRDGRGPRRRRSGGSRTSAGGWRSRSRASATR